ncbi:NADH dehydrogenase subunit 6 (mitochondrion) [Mauremys reevesii]|uniref:NADH dehydrogenase subunit 6 n=1 Tax=Mauremys reevesii TaxID=260615 RepID=Q6DKS2_MAURE|nr:NADH dehydrogenase subunit 6 [Mauremys reevesii]
MMYFMFLFGFSLYWMMGVSCNPSSLLWGVSLIFGALIWSGVLLYGYWLFLLIHLRWKSLILLLGEVKVEWMAEPYPVAWGSQGGVVYVVSYVLVVLVYGMMCYWLWSMEGYGSVTVDAGGLFVVRLDFSGVAGFYGVENGLLLMLVEGYCWRCLLC